MEYHLCGLYLRTLWRRCDVMDSRAGREAGPSHKRTASATGFFRPLDGTHGCVRGVGTDQKSEISRLGMV
eukprot:130819-Chlamydomonas_euryale.AAC.1